MRAANHTLLDARTSSDADGDVAALLAKLEATDSSLAILRYVANAPAAFRPFVLLANALLNKSALRRDTIEIVVLRIAQQLRVSYEWREHVPMAEQAGVPAAAIAALASGDLTADAVDDDAALAVRVADALAARGSLAPSLWADTIDRFGPAGAVELLLVVGWFAGLVPIVVHGLQLEGPLS